jgi:Flp pilus assembly protein TadG
MRRRLRRRYGDRGAAMVEMVLVVPFLFSLIMAIFEFGEGWQANLRVQSATRSAGRIGSSLTTDRQADYFMLQTLKAGLTKFTSAEVQRIVIFRANPSGNGEPTAACKNGTASVADSCNVYTGLQMNTLTMANFTSVGCAGGLDRFWCPTGRIATQANADYLGVWVQVFYDYRTNYFPGSGITLRQQVVMRLEPKVGS